MCESQKGLKHQSSQRSATVRVQLQTIINYLRYEKVTIYEDLFCCLPEKAARYRLLFCNRQAQIGWLRNESMLHVFYLAFFHNYVFRILAASKNTDYYGLRKHR